MIIENVNFDRSEMFKLSSRKQGFSIIKVVLIRLL